jgi:hypothetical protein
VQFSVRCDDGRPISFNALEVHAGNQDVIELALTVETPRVSEMHGLTLTFTKDQFCDLRDFLNHTEVHF